jgi:uncharacterized membrane protein HdeD (DUF308 family)
MRMAALVRNWWMMAGRGGLAIAFGLAILLWPNVTLPVVVVLFGAYAILDGAWALAAATWASGPLDAWPVALEGGVSIVLGVIALLSPWVPRDLVYVIAIWGVLTGALELLTAAGLPRDAVGYWLLATGGVSSLFLAVLVLLIPHADTDAVVRIIAAYAEVFGVVVLLASVHFTRGAPAVRRPAASRG